VGRPAQSVSGSWTLPLTAHGDALQQFDGGDRTVGIRGRGGASLLDPLGSATSHGCVRGDNSSIDWLVTTSARARCRGSPYTWNELGTTATAGGVRMPVDVGRARLPVLCPKDRVAIRSRVMRPVA
jgi:hypothetical protein